MLKIMLARMPRPKLACAYGLAAPGVVVMALHGHCYTGPRCAFCAGRHC